MAAKKEQVGMAVKVDTKRAITSVQNLKNEFPELRAEIDKTIDVLKKKLGEAGVSMHELGIDADKAATEIADVEVELTEVGDEAKKVIRNMNLLTHEINDVEEGADGAENKLKQYNTQQKKAGDGAGTTAGGMSKLTSTLGKVAGAFIAIKAGSVAFQQLAVESYNAFSQMEGNERKFNVTFGEFVGKAEKSAEALSNTFGYSMSSMRTMLGNSADIFTGMGMGTDEALKVADGVSYLGSALSKFNPQLGSAQDAVDALIRATTGERESLKRWGVIIKEVDIQNRLAEKGLDKLTGAARMTAVAQETLNIAMEQSPNALRGVNSASQLSADISRKYAESVKHAHEVMGKSVAEFFNPIKSGLAEAIDDWASTAEAIDRERAKFIDANKARAEYDDVKSLQKMIEQYELLSSKTNKSAEEAQTLKNIMSQLADKIPYAVEAWNEFGEVTELNVEQLKAVGVAQKELFLSNLEMGKIELQNKKDKAGEALAKAEARAERFNIEELKASVTKSLSDRYLKIEKSKQAYNNGSLDFSAYQQQVEGLAGALGYSWSELVAEMDGDLNSITNKLQSRIAHDVREVNAATPTNKFRIKNIAGTGKLVEGLEAHSDLQTAKSTFSNLDAQIKETTSQLEVFKDAMTKTVSTEDKAARKAAADNKVSSLKGNWTEEIGDPKIYAAVPKALEAYNTARAQSEKRIAEALKKLVDSGMTNLDISDFNKVFEAETAKADEAAQELEKASGDYQQSIAEVLTFGEKTVKDFNVGAEVQPILKQLQTGKIKADDAKSQIQSIADEIKKSNEEVESVLDFGKEQIKEHGFKPAIEAIMKDLEAGNLSAAEARKKMEKVVDEGEQAEKDFYNALDKIGVDMAGAVGSVLGSGRFDSLVETTKNGILGMLNLIPEVGKYVSAFVGGLWNAIAGSIKEYDQASEKGAEMHKQAFKSVYDREIDLLNERKQKLQEEKDLAKSMFSHRRRVLEEQYKRGEITSSEFLKAVERLGKEEVKTEKNFKSKEDAIESQKQVISSLENLALNYEKQGDNTRGVHSWGGADERAYAKEELYRQAREAVQNDTDGLSESEKISLDRYLQAQLKEIEQMYAGGANKRRKLYETQSDDKFYRHDPVVPKLRVRQAAGITININSDVYGVEDLHGKLNKAGKELAKKRR